MKLEAFGILLGLLHVICAVPTLTESRYEPQPDYVRHQFLESQGYIQNAEGESSESFKREIKKDLEMHGGGQLAFKDQQAEVQHDNVIRQGDTIALQTYRRDYWVSCMGGKCATSRCPKSFFIGYDWYKCHGEVFQIYKKRPGKILVGDTVGIYWPYQQRNWLSCSGGNQCSKSGCPGIPTMAYGFATPGKWSECLGEVFKIYVYKKFIGDIVTSGDLISLYYVHDKLWPNGGNKVEKNPCLGSAPPNPALYDHCSHEAFTIIKRP